MRWQRWMILLTLVLSTLLTSIWFYCASRRCVCADLLLTRAAPRSDSRGANCCLELRTILGCGPAGPCRGFAGDCADMAAQFADVQGPFLYSDGPGEAPSEHDSLGDWVCHAFPDDAYVTDQFFVGLISVAVALPVDLLLARAFEIANEGEMPENWLDLPPGKYRLLFGKDLHRGWHLDDPRRPVQPGALWLIENGDAPLGLVAFLLRAQLTRLARWLRGARSDKPEGDDNDASPPAPGSPRASGASDESAGAAARRDALVKRLYASAGLLGVYVCWTLFAWVIFVRAVPCACARASLAPILTRRPHPLRRRTACSSTSSSAAELRAASRSRGASATA